MAEGRDQFRHAVGVMTGTSIDGIDAAFVRMEGTWLDMRAELLRHLSRPLGHITDRLRAAAQQQPLIAGAFARLAWEFGELHTSVIAELIQSDCPDLICVHGQTIFHQPPHSLQLVNAAPIAQQFRCPVVFDLRQADLAAGGQGAPITPIADWILFRDKGKRRAIINLGGFCNVTILPAATNDRDHASNLSNIRGFDVCVCNQLLDSIAQRALGKAFDVDGDHARSGRANPQAAEALLEILDRHRRSGRSLGTGDEAFNWADQQLKASIASYDLAASAVEAIARCISAAIADHAPAEIILAGGGARNKALADALALHSRIATSLSDAHGIPIEAREAMAFAILGALCADGVPITLPHITGCSQPAPVSGTWCLPRGVRVPPR